MIILMHLACAYIKAVAFLIIHVNTMQEKQAGLPFVFSKNTGNVLFVVLIAPTKNGKILGRL